MCGSRKYPYPSHERSLEILRGWGGGGYQKPNFIKVSMELNWNFQRGEGIQTKAVQSNQDDENNVQRDFFAWHYMFQNDIVQ